MLSAAKEEIGSGQLLQNFTDDHVVSHEWLGCFYSDDRTMFVHPQDFHFRFEATLLLRILFDQVAGMVAKRHCFTCRFGGTEIKWENADVRFECGASSGFASLKRFSCWECYMKHRICICGSNHCNMKVDFLSSWCHRRLKQIGDDANSKFNHRQMTAGWNADMLDVAFKWQNHWQRWCNQFQ